jgi:hypothetical protein
MQNIAEPGKSPEKVKYGFSRVKGIRVFAYYVRRVGNGFSSRPVMAHAID